MKPFPSQARWSAVFFSVAAMFLLVLVAPSGSQAVDPKAGLETELSRGLDEICRKSQAHLDTLGAQALNVDADLTNLEQHVDQYLREVNTSVPLENRLWQIVDGCEGLYSGKTEELRQSERWLRQLRQLYIELERKFDGMTWNPTRALSSGSLGDLLSPQINVTELFSPASANLLKRLHEPAFYPVGYSVKALQQTEALAGQVLADHQEFGAILQQSIPDEGHFLRTLLQAERQARKCETAARNMIEQLDRQQEEMTAGKRTICDELRKTARKIDELFSTRPEIGSCIVVPDDIRLSAAMRAQGVQVYVLYQSGLQKKVDDSLVEYGVADPLVATVDQNGIVTAVGDGATEIHAVPIRGNPQRISGNAKVVVNLLSSPVPAKDAAAAPAVLSSQPSLDISVDPEKYSYPPGQSLSFTASVANREAADTYTFAWYLDDQAVFSEALAGNSSNRIRLVHAFKESGNIQVKLVMTSGMSGKSWSAVRTVNIEALPDAQCDIRITPNLPVYVPPVEISFAADCLYIGRPDAEYRWYIANTYVKSGREITHKFTESGACEIKLGVRLGRRFDEVTAKRTILIGSRAAEENGGE